jgi:hypothetical protein
MNKRCPHVEGCEMYEVFTLTSNLAIWQDRYCSGDYEYCARYKLSKTGEKVPPGLLPNASMLTKIRRK